jgi:hypothetical protein
MASVDTLPFHFAFTAGRFTETRYVHDDHTVHVYARERETSSMQAEGERAAAAKFMKQMLPRGTYVPTYDVRQDGDRISPPCS